MYGADGSTVMALLGLSTAYSILEIQEGGGRLKSEREPVDSGFTILQADYIVFCLIFKYCIHFLTG